MEIHKNHYTSCQWHEETAERQTGMFGWGDTTGCLIANALKTKVNSVRPHPNPRPIANGCFNATLPVRRGNT